MKQVKLALLIIGSLGVFVGSCEFEDINYLRPVPAAREATEVTSSGFVASWNPIEGQASYTVLVSTANTFEQSNLLEGYPKTTNRTNFRVTRLEADQMYYYAIKTDSEPTTEHSNVIETKTLPLSPPQILNAVDITPLSFVAGWRSVPEAENYLLYVSADINFTDHLSGYNGKVVSDTTALVEDLEINESYFYRVKTSRGESVSRASAVARVSTSQLAKPVLLNNPDANYTSITINWEAVEGATSYLVYLGTDRFVITETLPEYNPREVINATSLVAVGLNANTTYYYQVQAKNDLSESERSDVGSSQTISLEIPAAREATNAQIDGFQANWDPVPDASSYVLDIARDPEFTNFLNGYNAKEVVDTTEVVSGLLRNTTYYYRVRAKGFGSFSGNSRIITIQTVSFASPRALEATELQSTSFRAVWQPVTSVDAYYLDVATDASFENILPSYQALEVSDTTQQVTGLTVNNRYFYRVRAAKGSVFSGYSNIVDLTTTTLSAPTIKPATGVGLTSFTINWESVPGATRYRVDVGTDPLVENKIATDYDNRLVDSGLSLEVTELNANTTYYFKVRAENEMSTGGSSVGSAKTNSIDIPVLEAPSDVELTSFVANWQAVASASSYLLDVATDADFQNPVVSNREVTSISESVIGLEPNTLYYYRVRARGEGSTSDYPPDPQASVKTAPLSSPTVQAASNRGVYRFTANWTAVTEADRYVLYVATDASFSPASMLSNYDGREVLGTSHELTGLDPYTSYYYRVKSKKSETESTFSASYTTVEACLGNDCRLTKRTFAGWREETYGYTGQLLTSITLYDISGGAPVEIRESSMVYSGNRIQQATVEDQINSANDRVWTFTYDNAKPDQIESILIENGGQTQEVGQFDFEYNSSDQLTKLKYEDKVTSEKSYEERYDYGVSNQVLVNNKDDELIKRLRVGADFNTESMLLSDVALLLFNPTDPGEHQLPFIPATYPTYYQYRKTTSDSWNYYSYSYDLASSKDIPSRVFPINGIPELTYSFTTECGL